MLAPITSPSHLPLYALDRFNGSFTWRVWSRLVPQQAPTHRHFLDRMTPHFLKLLLMLFYQETLSPRPVMQKKPRKNRQRHRRLRMEHSVVAWNHRPVFNLHGTPILISRAVKYLNMTREVSIPHRTHNSFQNILTSAKMTNCLCHNSSLPLRLSQIIRSAYTLYQVMMNIQNRHIPQPTLPTTALAHIWILIPMGLRDLVILANICVESAQNCKYKMRRWEVVLRWCSPRQANCSAGFLFTYANPLLLSIDVLNAIRSTVGQSLLSKSCAR